MKSDADKCHLLLSTNSTVKARNFQFLAIEMCRACKGLTPQIITKLIAEKKTLLQSETQLAIYHTCCEYDV